MSAAIRCSGPRKRQSVNDCSFGKLLNPAFYMRSHRNRERQRMKINQFRKAGFTLVEIMIVVAIIALLAAIAIPNFVKARTASQKTACIANMKQIEGAKATWAMETKKT